MSAWPFVLVALVACAFALPRVLRACDRRLPDTSKDLQRIGRVQKFAGHDEAKGQASAQRAKDHDARRRQLATKRAGAAQKRKPADLYVMPARKGRTS